MSIRVFSIVAILLLGMGINMNAQDKKDKKNDKETVVFDVSMTCENCKKRIEKNIAYEKGVVDMKVDLPAKTVEVVFKKDKTTIDKLQAAFEKLGYEANLRTDNKQKEDEQK